MRIVLSRKPLIYIQQFFFCKVVMLKQISEAVWEIEREGSMRVPGRVYGVESVAKAMGEGRTLGQLRNVASLPGIQKYALVMPDGHEGYGFPIGGVAAFDLESGVVSPGGVGYDINCGVRLIATPIPIAQARAKLRELVDLLFKNVPSGVGSKGKLRLEEREFDQAITEGANWAIAKGYGFAEDAKHCEENGCIGGADPSVVSPMAKKRGRPQFGTVGAGNHFVEIQEVQQVVKEDVAKVFGLQKGNACVMIHTGSRGFGHQVCDDNLRVMVEAAKKYGIELPDRELCCAPINSPEAQRYLKAMRCAVNFAFCNRQVMTHWVRETFGSVFGKSTMDDMKLVYDVCHNIAKFEEHEIDGHMKTVCVHRKGATRAFAPGRKEIPQAYREVGQPVLIPGSMGTASYVLVGKQEGMNSTFGSSCHGAGRVMSRSKAVHSWKGTDVQQKLMGKNIMVKATEPELIAEEAPEAYKNVDDVVKSVQLGGISDIVARLVPIGVVKG